MTGKNTRLAVWLTLVLLYIGLQYAVGHSSTTSGKDGPQVLYRYSSVAAVVIQGAVTLAIMGAVGGFSRDLFAIVRPVSWSRALWFILLGLVTVYAFSGIYASLVHTGNEQGLTPSHWEPSHAGAYIANGIVLCTVIPFAEELTFRGLGYSLLERFGRWPAIVVVGVLFGLAHGLALELPILILFGCILAWIRSESRSVFPGMVLHGLFNMIALIAAVTFAN